MTGGPPMDIDQQYNCPTLAVVLPCFNEEAVIQETFERLNILIKELIRKGKVSGKSFILAVDDGSADLTWNKVEALAAHDHILKGLKLSRNYGHQNALLAGLLSVRNRVDCAISIDADLQQDENAIPLFLEKYRAGAEIVYGVRNDRGSDGWGKRLSATAFYDLMMVMGVKIIKNHADYRLMSKKALHALAQYDEVNLFLRGIVTDIGYKTDCVYFDVKQRFAGDTKYSVRRMFSFAIDGITSFSVTPLRIVTAIGFLVFSLALVMAGYVVIKAVLVGDTVPGWASTVLPIYFMGGVQLVCTGLLGEYIGKIYKELKARPRYLIDKEIL